MAPSKIIKRKLIKNLYFVLSIYHTASRYVRLNKIRDFDPLKVYYGCGNKRQPGYLNVDIRYTPAIDVVADLNWCAKYLEGACQEVYLSHVLEHYNSPGKNVRNDPNSVLGALLAIKKMLMVDGIVRIAVPDFGVLVRLYVEHNEPIYPKLLGRLCGEQDYPQNLHKCAFDRQFLDWCLQKSGFVDIEEWSPESCSIQPDASFDQIDGISTSLNLLARKSK